MTKRAVVVGINDYTGIDASGNSNLNCSVADANSVVSMLSDAFGFDASDVTLITDQAATRDAVLAGLTTMIGASQAGDVALFYYSGHGSMQADDPNDPNCQLNLSSEGVVVARRNGTILSEHVHASAHGCGEGATFPIMLATLRLKDRFVWICRYDGEDGYGYYILDPDNEDFQLRR